MYVTLENWHLEIHEVNSVGASMFFQSRLEIVYARVVQDTEDIWVELEVATKLVCALELSSLSGKRVSNFIGIIIIM